MEESTTYQYILNQGRIKGVRETLLDVGRMRFGEPNATTIATLESITDLKSLQRLMKRAVLVTTWEDLLATL